MNQKTFFKLLTLLLCLQFLFSCNAVKNENSADNLRWAPEKAKEWYNSKQWMIGSDFIPSTAINQLEMWQAETFDTVTINRELSWAESIGFNTMRVYLHHVAWEVDTEGFKNRINQYLTIADKHGIGTIFVIFDDCWNAKYAAGKQPEPRPGIHNSGWLRDPGDLIHLQPELVNVLEKYVTDLMTTFISDKRIVLWDLYNEPGNSNYGITSMPLLMKVFSWARKVNPSQPISSAVWNYGLKELNKFQVENSDVITYHNYDNDTLHKLCIDSLRTYGRPLICTEYMARKRNSRFANITPMLKKENIAAINWGFVAGKTNTIYSWDTPIPDGSEPTLWFHDIFRKDGTPYKVEEIVLLKSLTGKK